MDQLEGQEDMSDLIPICLLGVLEKASGCIISRISVCWNICERRACIISAAHS